MEKKGFWEEWSVTHPQGSNWNDDVSANLNIYSINETTEQKMDRKIEEIRGNNGGGIEQLIRMSIIERKGKQI